MLDFLLLCLSFFVGFFCNLLSIFKFLCQLELVLELNFIGFELCLFVLKTLLLLKKFLVFDAHNVTLVSPFSREGRKLVFEDLDFSSQVRDSFKFELFVLILLFTDISKA